MERLLDGLNAAQKAAVTSPSKVLQVLAPPGSGKTKTLTARVAYQIAQNGLNPSNVIVCTFTIKAAREMQHRIQGLLGSKLAGRLILGTFHSIARRFLARYGKHIDIDQGFGIADAGDSNAIVARIIKQKSLTTNPKIARNRISGLKASGISAEQNAARAARAKGPSTDKEELSAIYTAYQEQLDISNLLDYDDLLLKCVELVRAYPQCVANIEAVLIDEFQDTNDVQYDLMTLLAHQNEVISIVGDPDQSIYGWRSAKIENLVRMQNAYPETHLVNLAENYRSSACILLAAQEIIEQDRDRPQKALAATHSAGERPTLRRLGSAAEEGNWIVSEIQRSAALTGGLLTWDDFAVLLRSAAQSRLIEASLGKAGIPYRMVGGHRFFDRVEVKLLLDYLRVLDHLDHTDALVRIVNVPARGVGDTSVGILLKEASERRWPLWTVVVAVARGEIKTSPEISKPALKGLESLVNLILRGREKLTTETKPSLTSFVETVADKVGIKRWISCKYPGNEEYDERWANVEELITQAAEAAHSIRNDNVPTYIINDKGEELEEETTAPTQQEELSHFLTHIALSTDSRQKEDDENHGGHVVLSTMHAAKGLEWPVVFVPAVYEGSIPHSRAEDTDEERRLLYVAMTRAQSLLYMSCPHKASAQNEVQLSQFLTPTVVKSYCANRGPTFTHDLVRELAKILRREKQPLDIEKGRASIDRLEDDYFDQYRDGGSNDQDDMDELIITNDGGEEMYSNHLKRSWSNDRSSHRGVPTKKRAHATTALSTITATTLDIPRKYEAGRATYTSFTSAKLLPQRLETNKENLGTYDKHGAAKEKRYSSGFGSKSLGSKRQTKGASDERNIATYFSASSAKSTTCNRQAGPDLPGAGLQIPLLSRIVENPAERSRPGSLTLESDRALASAQIPSVSRHETTPSYHRTSQPPKVRSYGARPAMDGWKERMNR